MAAADFEPSLAEAVLEDRPVPDQVLYQALLRGIRAGTLLPALCGSAMAGKGVGELLDLVAALATEPENASAPLSARVFKVEADRTMGKVAHVRLYAGTVRARDGVLVQRTGAAGKDYPGPALRRLPLRGHRFCRRRGHRRPVRPGLRAGGGLPGRNAPARSCAP